MSSSGPSGGGPSPSAVVSSSSLMINPGFWININWLCVPRIKKVYLSYRFEKEIDLLKVGNLEGQALARLIRKISPRLLLH